MAALNCDQPRRPAAPPRFVVAEREASQIPTPLSAISRSFASSKLVLGNVVPAKRQPCGSEQQERLSKSCPCSFANWPATLIADG